MGDPLPWWFRGALVAALALVVSVAVAGTVLAMLGWFRLVTLVVVAAPVFVLLLRAARPMLGRCDDSKGVRPAALALAFTLVFVGLQAREATQHVIVDRDPGVYLNTGVWLARDGDLFIDTDSRAFGEPLPAHVRFDTPGFYSGAPGGRLYPQFLHVLPVLLATGDLIGGVGLATRLPAILAGLALLTIYAFATRFLRPKVALAVMVLTAINLTTVVFARDSYTEPLSQALLFGALWMMWPTGRRVVPGLGTFVGFLLGVCVMTRIDAIAYLIPLVAWAFFEHHRDRSTRRWLGPATIAAAVPIAIAAVDAEYFARPYTSDLAASIVPLLAAFVAVIAIGLLSERRPQPARRIGAWFRAHRNTIAIAAGGGTGALAFALWIVRPLVSTVRSSRDTAYAANLAALQGAEHVAVDGARTYAEQSVEWLGWYLGPTVVAMGFAGLAYLIWRLSRGEQRELAPFVALFSLVTLLYAWRPSIDPNQVWAMRRFFPVTLPGLLLLAAVGGEAIVGWLQRLERLRFSARDRRRIGIALVIALAGPALVIPLRELRPVLFDRELTPLLSDVDAICAALPAHALVYLPQPGLFTNRLAQPLRGLCGANVAVGDVSPTDADVMSQLEVAARGAGRPLFVVSETEDPFAGAAAPIDAPQLVETASYQRLELSVESVPDSFWDEQFDVWVARWA
ncbi:MAG TPA: hypothetical protein VGZ52_12670 [Acidimicrobiales bacterium]|nr:hypothetical protein [Acidimicrobiales bacterium]